MKRKNFLKSVAALICVATLGTAALTGCGGGSTCEHVYTWTVHEGDESTCTEAGTKTGVCGICGDIKEEAIPLDPTAHDYSGEWTIEKPTEANKGKAYKTCLHNEEHKLEVELPQVTLSGKDYDLAEFITVPNPKQEGEIHLELKHPNGVIAFNAPLAKRKIVTVEDAVIIASSLGSKVRKSDGYFKEGKEGVQNNFYTYYGDDYTSIKETGDNTETWYSHDEDGKIFAMSQKGNDKPLVVAYPAEENMMGFHYQSATDTSSFYGAEQGLKKIYEIAQSAKEHNTCVNYRERKEKLNDEAVNAVRGEFSFSYFENPFFCRYEVKFETFEDGMLKKLEVNTEIIRSYMFATDEDGNFLFYKEGDGYTDSEGIEHKQHAGDVIFAPEYPHGENGENLYAYDKDGNVRYEQQDENGNLIYSYEDASGNTVYQKVFKRLETIDKPDGTKEQVYVLVYEDLDYVPELHDVYLTDQYGMELVNSKGEKIKKKMAIGGKIVDYYSDDHYQVSHRYAVFNQTPKVDGEEVIPNKYNSESLYIKSFDIVSAEYGPENDRKTKVFDGKPIVLPTNTAIDLNIGNIMPTTAGLSYDPVESIYVIDPTGQRVELKSDFNVGSIYNIFAYYNVSNEKILINSRYKGEVNLLFVTKAGKCEKIVPIKFTPQEPSSLSARASVYNVTDGVPGYTEQEVNQDKPVTLITGQTLKIWAEATGEEAGYAGTDIKPFAFDEATGVRDGVEFTQADSGSYREWNLVATKPGTYIVRMPYFDGETTSSVYAAFKLIVTERPDTVEMVSGKTFTCSVQISEGVGSNPDPKTLTAEFTVAEDGTDGVKNGKINISVGGNTSVYAYEISADGKLSAKYESGVGPTVKTYDFMFSINDAGDIIISHSTGMGKDTEDIVLTEKTA